jgi:hypothetical protein
MSTTHVRSMPFMISGVSRGLLTQTHVTYVMLQTTTYALPTTLYQPRSTNHALPTTLYQLSPRLLVYTFILWELPLAAQKRLFHRPHTLLVGVAAFNGLKTRALCVILSLIKNIRSILTRTHHERSFDHVDRNKRTQAEAGSIRLSAVPHTWVCSQAEAGSIRLSAVPHTWVCSQAEADFIIPEAKRNPRQGAKALAKWDNSPLSAKPPWSIAEPLSRSVRG